MRSILGSVVVAYLIAQLFTNWQVLKDLVAVKAPRLLRNALFEHAVRCVLRKYHQLRSRTLKEFLFLVTLAAPKKDRQDTLEFRFRLAHVLYRQGRWHEAQEMYGKVLEVRTRILVASKHSLANDLYQQSRWSEAEEMCREVLEVQKRILGEEHPDTLVSRSNLASAIYEQGRRHEAQEMYRKVLEARTRILVARKQSLANDLYQQSRWSKAEEMFKEVLEMQKRILGEEHPDTLVSRNNLASALQRQGQWHDAEGMHRDVLEVQKRIVGEEHPDTLVSMNNLASVLEKQGRWHEAEEMCREVLEVRKRIVGREPPHTWNSRNNLPQTLIASFNLSSVLENQGRWHQAEEMYREVLKMQKRILGDEHPDTLVSRNNLASALQSQGRWHEAEEMCKELLEVQKRILGEEQPDTLVTRNNLASALQRKGQWHEAEDMHRDVLEVQKRILGEQHPDALVSKRNLAGVLEKQGRWHEAEEMYKEVLEVRKRILGDVGVQHPDMLLCRDKLATPLKMQGNWQEAEAGLREVLSVRARVLGEDHPDTLETLSNLATVVAERDQHDWSFRCSLTGTSHADRLVDAEGKLRAAIKGLQQKVDDDHPRLLSCRFALAKLLAQMNQPENISEVECMLPPRSIPQLCKQFGLQDSRTQEATRDLVFMLEEQGKDAEEWRQLFLVMENPEKTPVFSAEQESLEKFLGEEWGGTDKLLRGLLGKDYPLCHGQIVKAASSNATSSSAQASDVCTESSANASSSEMSLDSLDFLVAAHLEKIQERKEREEEQNA